MLKKVLSIITLIAVCMSSTVLVSAEGGFNVKHGVISLKEELCDINIAIPDFDDFPGSDNINMQLRNMISDSIGQARTSAGYIKNLNDELIIKGEKPVPYKVTLDTTYDYIKSGDILSLQFNTYMYLGGAHPTNWINSITSNMSTGEIYTLENLFKENSDFVEILTNRIITVIDKNPDFYFSDYAQTIKDKKGNFDFYIDGNKLVIFFNLYEIAPYAAGIRRFVFDAEDLKGILKEDVYNSIKASKPLGAVRYNGSDLNTDKKSMVTDKGIMLPLRVIAETLGYKVDWNEKEGAIVAGGFIKEGVNSYWKTGIEPVSLTAPVVINGVTYVPIQYFRDILEENVSFGNMNYTYVSDTGLKNNSETVIRIFSKADYVDNFNNLIAQFKNPVTAEECINEYAEAVKSRNGAVQYALLNNKLREEKYSYFNEIGFVTGVSSPWVESFDINKTGENSYQITFHMKTSSPAPVPDEIINVSLIQHGDYCRISSLKTVER